jgi:hypothetical protein
MVSVIGKFSGDRVPVDMNIPDGHEDRNLYSFIIEIFAFIGLFHHYDLTVRRCIYEAFLRGFTLWIPEEPQDEKPEEEGGKNDGKLYPEHPGEPYKAGIQDGQYDKKHDRYTAPFFVYHRTSIR